MGDPKKHRKKYSGPRHPWEKERIDEENVLKKEYGLRNKKEIWKMRSLFKGFADQAKHLIALKTQQAEKEKRQLLTKLSKLGLIKATDDLNAVLGLDFKNLLERRLQTLLFKKGLSRSVSQARQFITHGHVMVGSKKVTSPSYLVAVDEETKLGFSPGSSLSKEDHPERGKEK